MTEWNFTNRLGKALPKPMHWDDHPEWFDLQDGHARRLRGPRFVDPQGKSWVWGPTERVHELGEYVVLHFRWDYSRFGFGDQEQHGKEGFAVWVNGQPVDTTWNTLDEALVDAVRFKYEGPRGSSGPRATEYFLRMVGASEGKP